MSKHPMTIAGAQRLKAELHQLKTVERPTIVRAIGEARLHGDISENAEYHAAKERQGFIEARIRDVESSSRTRTSSIRRRSMPADASCSAPRSISRISPPATR